MIRNDYSTTHDDGAITRPLTRKQGEKYNSNE